MSNTTVEYLLRLKDQFSNPIAGATKKTERLNAVVSQTQKSFTNLGGALGIGLGAAGVVQFGKAVVDSLVNYEYFSASLRTLMMGDAQAAKALENQLVQTAKTTPFSLVEVQDATKQLLAYGFSASSVVDNIRMLGDVASALKIPFSDIAYLYGTLKTQGRAFSKDIYQFTGRGIPVVKELAKQFNVADSEVMKLVEDGKVGFKDIEKAFQSMTAEGGMFFNMMDEQSKTTGGRISMLGDSFEQLKVNIGKSQTGIIASTVAFANRLIDNISRAFAESNQQFENYQKYGAEQFRSTFNPLSFFEIGARGEQVQYEKALKAIYVDTPAKTLKDAVAQQTELTNMLSNLRTAFNKKEIDDTEFYRKRAAIYGTLEAVKGQIGLLKTPTSATQAAAQGLNPKDGTKSSTSKSGTSTTAVESRGVTNFNITIQKLVEQITMNTSNMKEGANEIKQAVAQALIEAVNDFQLMATK